MSIVIELIGGEDVARDVVLSAIDSGKHVVTANKALLAEHGHEIFDAAAAAGVDVGFEASGGRGDSDPPLDSRGAVRESHRVPGRHPERHDQLHADRDGEDRRRLR